VMSKISAMDPLSANDLPNLAYESEDDDVSLQSEDIKQSFTPTIISRKASNEKRTRHLALLAVCLMSVGSHL
jgi:hypothetical protein